MILHIDFDHFGEEVRHRVGEMIAYVTPLGIGCRITSAHPSTQLLLMTSTSLDREGTEAKLKEQGFEVRTGQWAMESEGLDTEARDLWVMSVAYRSEERMPGLWVDVDLEEQTNAEIMRRMYDDFIHNGEIKPDITLEQFVDVLSANVVVLSPEEQRRMAVQNRR